MFKFSIKKILLEEVGKKISYSVEGSIVDLALPEDIRGDRIKGNVVFIKLEDTILAKATLEAEVILICDRCLSNFEKTLEIEMEREYNINRQGKNEEGLYIDKYADLELDEPIREEIILAVPMKNICRGDCLGICPDCGVNLNIEECKCCNK